MREEVYKSGSVYVNLEEYIRIRKESYAEAIKRFKDPTVFDLNITPRRIYEREELKIIADKMIGYMTTNIPSNIIIYGSKGSGKTVSMLHIAKILEKDGMKVFYLKARAFPSSYSIYRAITGYSKVGYSIVSLREKAIEKLKAEKTPLLIIDDADFLEDTDFLYHILRDTRTSIILLTQSLQFIKKKIDDSTLSSLQPLQIFFSEYNADELYQILKLRAEDGLNEYNDTALHLIAALVARESRGDARIAITSLFNAALKNVWDEEGIKEIVQEATREVEKIGLRELKDRDFLLLYVISKNKETNKAYVTFNELLEKLEGIKVSKTIFFRMLNYLQTLGLITQVRKRVGRYFTTEIDLLIGEDLIENERKIRFQEKIKL